MSVPSTVIMIEVLQHVTLKRNIVLVGLLALLVYKVQTRKL